MLHVSSTHQLDRRLRLLLSIAMLVALLGAISTPSPGLAQDNADPIISLSSADASACSDDENASCETILLTVDFTHTASYEFDCHRSPVHVPWFKALAALLGIDIPWWIPDPTPDSAICTYLAQGSTFKVYESGNPNPIVDKTYTGWKQEGQFTVQPSHTYELKLNGHGRDFREIMEANGLTFDSFANVTYQEIDPNDDICRNAIPFDLPYSGNLEFSGDHDWQQIQSPVKGTMVLTLGVPEGKDYQLEVWNDACSAIWILSQNGTGVDEQFVMPVDQAYYRVHVFGKTTADFGVWYSVSALWDLDDNQWENAAPFTPPFQGNLEYGGDQDWQKITIPVGGTTLVLDVPDGKNYDLELWQDDVKTKLAESKNSSGVDEFIPIAQPGIYRIHIYGVNPASDFNAWYGVFLEGTGAVTLVRDITEGSASSNLSELTSVNGTLYFITDNRLWKSDGTEEGTVRVVDSAGTGDQPSFSNPHDLVEANGNLYFVAKSVSPWPGEDVWVTDGTPDGTRRLNLVGNPGGSISELTTVNGNVYFVLRDCGPGSSLCDILMNLNGEILRETVAFHPNIPAYSSLTSVNGILFFIHSDYRSIPTNPPTPPKPFWELMKVTGADEVPVAVGDIPGDENNPPGNFHAAGGTLYFVANDGIYGPKLWRSDGSTIEMVPAVAGDIPQIGGAYGLPQEITFGNGDVYFTDGRALWAVDNTGAARGVFCYFLTTSCVGSIGHLGRVDDTVYFVHSWEYGTTLYKYDGNAVTTIKFYATIPFPFFVPTIDHLTDVNGRLYFAANDGTNGAELWTSDGTSSGTAMVADIAMGTASSSPNSLINVNGVLFFTADDTVHGNELWRTVVDNRSPTAEANGPYVTNEGSFVTLDASASSDLDGDLLTYTWDLNNDGEYNDAAGAIVETSFPDDGQYPVAVRATDPAGAQSTDSAIVNVLNVAPAIPGAINTTGKPALINTNLEFSAAFTDPGILDTHTALWDWGDGTTSPGLVSSYNVTGSHSYNKAGLYAVTLSIADDDGASAAKSYQYVVVVDPKAGFVTGGGWFRYSNKIGQFGFVAHYLPRDTNAPVGSVVFQVPSSRFVFSSTQFNWLVIDGSKATIRGAGKINGKGSYQFLLTVTDGSPDSIRIKIWDQATGLVFYDTQPGASDTADPTLSIKGGSIRIHKPK